MGLSEHEQRLLDEMERGLYASEADSLKTRSVVKNRPSYRAILVGTLSIVVGIGLLVAAVSLHFIWLGAIGFAVMLFGVLFAFSSKNQVDVQGAGGGQGPSESFAQKAERRWEQRMDGER